MVYEQDGRRWIFFRDLFGQWQWALIDGGVTLEQSPRSFRTFCRCMRDARGHGFHIRRARSRRVPSETLEAQPSAATVPRDA